MKLEEIIEYFDDLAEDLYARAARAAMADNKYANWCEERAEQNKQLADWLKDYQRLLNAIENIKAEIEESRYGMINDGLDVALNIINKHIGEGERMENE